VDSLEGLEAEAFKKSFVIRMFDGSLKFMCNNDS